MKTLYLTVDVDWANDFVFSRTVDFLEQAGVKATIFLTHETSVLDRMRNRPDFELGLHPNYRPLLTDPTNNDDIKSIFKRLRDKFPEALSVRNHCLIGGSDISKMYADQGLTHFSNLLIPFGSGIVLRAFKTSMNLISVPFGWEDDVHCSMIASGLARGWHPDSFLLAEGLKVFNFHPQHLFLNTENLKRIDFRCKSLLHSNEIKQSDLYAYINHDSENGSRIFLEKLVDQAKNAGFRFGLIRDISVL